MSCNVMQCKRVFVWRDGRWCVRSLLPFGTGIVRAFLVPNPASKIIISNFFLSFCMTCSAFKRLAPLMLCKYGLILLSLLAFRWTLLSLLAFQWILLSLFTFQWTLILLSLLTFQWILLSLLAFQWTDFVVSARIQVD